MTRVTRGRGRRRTLMGTALALLCGLALLSAARAGTAAAAQATRAPAPGVCGDGVLDHGEACDDGNRAGGDGCSPACAIEEQCYDRAAFSFFSWSDSYTGAGRSGVLRMFADAFDAAKYPDRVFPRFWVSPGDIPYMADGPDALDKLNARIRAPQRCSAAPTRFPYFVALGNHDVDGYTRLDPADQYTYWREVVGPRLDHSLPGLLHFREGPHRAHEARTTYSFDYQNAHFVIVNQYAGDPRFPTPNPRACIGPELLDWIDKDLAATRSPVKFVFGHEPAWPFCSTRPGYGGKEACPASNPDHIETFRPRPYSATGAWGQPYGHHWGDSLDSDRCPAGSRDAFWRTLARHRVAAHYVGHTHCYSSRLVQMRGSDLVRRTDVSPYAKAGASFALADGVWEIDTAQTHTSAGAVYVMTTVGRDAVTFEAFDQRGKKEPFALVERWSVRVGD